MFQNPINLLETTFQYLSLCGVCPNSLRDSKVPWTRKVVNGFVAIFPLQQVLINIIRFYYNYVDIIAFILVIGVFWWYINSLVCILTPLGSAEALVKFFKILEQAQLTISSLDIAQPPVPSRLVQRFYIWGCGILPLFTSAVLLGSFLPFYVTSVTILQLAIVWATLIKFKMMLLFIDLKFNIVNDHLKEVSDQTVPLTMNGGVDTGDYISSHFYDVKKKIKDKVDLDNYKGITVDRILKFNRAHFQLCDAHKVLSEMFSSIGFVMTMAVSFDFVKAFLISDDISSICINIHVYNAAFLSMFLFISLMTSATNVKNNAMKTGYLIHELLTDDHAPDIEEELMLFSQLLRHRKLTISAEGFFVIDLKLLTRIVCLLTPLILIMVQQKEKRKMQA